MGDNFVLLVDQLLTESTLEAAIEKGNLLQQGTSSYSREDTSEFSHHRMDIEHSQSPTNLVQCRICHDEDVNTNMEVPCSCRGSLKYAHRKCVQRWCNEKGDTICEICQQQFKPDYSSPPLFHHDEISMNFRENWEIPGLDLNNSPFIAMATTDPDYLDSDTDEYPALSPRSLLFCRIVTIIFIVLLMLCYTLPIVISGAGAYSLTLSMSLILRTIGILLPIYLMVKAFTAIQRWHRHQDRHFSPATSDEESDLEQVQPWPLCIHAH